MFSFRTVVIASVIMGTSLCRPAQASATDQAAINKAVDNAVEYLKHARTGNSWTHSHGKLHGVGLTALCTIALLEAGVPRNDPVIVGGAKFVRDSIPLFNDPNSPATYCLSLAIIMLDRIYQDESATALIKQLTVRVAAGQDKQSGGWGYTCPPLAGAKYNEVLDYLKNSEKEPLPEDSPPDMNSGISSLDHSNTQFAVLALWVGRRHHVPVNRPLFLAERRFRKLQERDGGWNYGPTPDRTSTPAMTCSGLLALALGFSSSKESGVTIVRGGAKFDANAGPDGKTGTPPTETLDTDSDVIRARRFISGYCARTQLRNFPSFHYFLWSLERVCVTYGWEKDIEGWDWYGWGSNILVQTQGKEGGWGGDPQSGSIAETAFCILFLRKADLIPDVRNIMKQVVRSGKVSDIAKDKNKTAKTTPGRSDTDKPAAEPKEKSPKEVETERQTADAAKWRDTVTTGAGPRQEEALAKLRDTPGKPYTLAMVETIKKVGGGALQNQVRDALAERLKRQTADGLRYYLKYDDRELKSAAAWAAALQPCKEVCPEIILLLGDTDEMVSSKALESLKILSGGQDFGKSAERWKAWWDKSGKSSPN